MTDLSTLIPVGHSLMVLRWQLPSGRPATVNIGCAIKGGFTLQQAVDAVYGHTWGIWDDITDASVALLPTIGYTNLGAGIGTAIAAGTNKPGLAVNQDPGGIGCRWAQVDTLGVHHAS